jgi:hypothetical protein
MPRHKKDTAEFGDLDFQGQTRSLNATAVYLRRALRAHARLASANNKNVAEVIENRLQVLERAIAAIRTQFVP